ncbi:MAG: class I SAM-dependent methyltransferase [Gammaproteobacteria bacterium]|nr:class I SAM-dependent methyltransferase [Gammaproteobacteria bacterium]
MTTAIANSEQIRYWNDEAALRWLEMQDELDRIVHPFGEAAMVAADVAEGHRVLDIGCGCGRTTLALAALVGQRGSATGVDVSSIMLQHARSRAAGLGQIQFNEADAQTHDFPDNYYHRIYSRFGVMFFDDPIAAFSNLARALMPTGMISFVCWQPPAENPWLMEPMQAVNEYLPPPEPPVANAPGPFAFADPERVKEILTAAGLSDIRQESLQHGINLGKDAAEATRFAVRVGPASSRFTDAPEEKITAATQGIQRVMSAYETEDGVIMTGSARIVVATKA